MYFLSLTCTSTSTNVQTPPLQNLQRYPYQVVKNCVQPCTQICLFKRQYCFFVCWRYTSQQTKYDTYSLIIIVVVPDAPSGFTTLNMSGRHAVLMWGPPMFANGIIQSYQLRYFSLASPTLVGCSTGSFVRLRRQQDEFQMETQRLALANLCPDTEYTVVLTASTRLGEGKSARHTFNTSG